MMRIKKSAKNQQGMILIEALVAIVIFMIGVLGIVGLTVKSAGGVANAQYRTEAGLFASQIIQRIWLGVDRTTEASLKTSLAAFSHQAGGGSVATGCDFSGNETNQAAVSEILAAARAEAAPEVVPGLPGANKQMQQVLVDTSVPGINKVTVTLCWQGPQDEALRNYQINAYIN